MFPTLQEMLDAEQKHLVTMSKKDGMVAFKYSRPAVYAREWNNSTLNARGTVYDAATGEILARPFPKFFNYSELFATDGKPTALNELISGIDGFKPELSGNFRAMDKIDGSLIIVFHAYGEWHFKTAGMFDTIQADAAKKWGDENLVFEHMDSANTYCFEFISPEFLHPIAYDTTELVLLGVISNETGIEATEAELSEISRNIGVRLADTMHFSTLEEAIEYATALPVDKEGIVITFDNGTKLKIKGTEFLKRQALFHEMSEPKSLYAAFDPETGKVPDSLMQLVPEEFNFVFEFAKELEVYFSETYAECIGIIEFAKANFNSDRERFEYVQTVARPVLVPAIMQSIRGKPDTLKMSIYISMLEIVKYKKYAYAN